MPLLAGESAPLATFSAYVRARFGELALFGSRARGEGNEDSGVDVLVVVDDPTGAEARAVAFDAAVTFSAEDAGAEFSDAEQFTGAVMEVHPRRVRQLAHAGARPPQ